MKVKIISGTYGQKIVAPETGVVRVKPIAKGEQAEVSNAEAARLVGLGVAAYITEEKPTDTVITLPPAHASDNPGSNIPNIGSVTEGQGAVNDDEPGLEIVGGHYTVDSLMQLTRKKLEELANTLGVDSAAVKKCTGKSGIAALIAAVEVAEEDDEPPHPTAAVPGT